MNLYYMGVYQYRGNWLEIFKSEDLSSIGFFKRSTIREIFPFISKNLITRIQDGPIYQIEHEGYWCHLARWEDTAVTIITDRNYPYQVASRLVRQTMGFGKLTNQDLCNLHKTYQKPEQADKIYQVSQKLNKTTEIVRQTVDQVLERGTKLEDLVEKSDSLSQQSKIFYKTSKKMNRCCIIS